MQKIPFSKPSSFLVDSLFFLFVGAILYGLTAFGAEWKASYNPSYKIDLSLTALPMYALFSALRGLIAYFISLAFTLVIGYWAAKSLKAEKVILPLLDIMQSIPVLGFLPGLVLGLVAIFPRTNVGLELASIIMIFTGQVWNMTFAFYSSLKSVPIDLKEAVSVMELSPIQRLKLLELPYSAMNLTWNSLMSMAGGWFFLTVCEAFTLGNNTYRLPGLGAYMAVAIESGSAKEIVAGITAMAFVIILFDMLLWRPALVWAHRFRLEDNLNQTVEEPFIQILIRESFIIRLFRFLYIRRLFIQHRRISLLEPTERLKAKIKFHLPTPPSYVVYSLYALAICFAVYATLRLFGILASISFSYWVEILTDTGFTFLRVIFTLVIGTLWATPLGIWITQDSKRLRVAQPIIQLLASFPAPMLYPLAISVFLFLHINFEISSMLLMLLGVQWYILFNVLAGALRIPSELRLSMQLMNSSTWQQWRYLFLPSVLPALVTGWVTAAGGAWNASIVSELISYKGTVLKAHGLGAKISEAAEQADFPRLAACLFVMVLFVVILNRTFWSKLYRVSQVRFRLDL